jgi:polar amino acid transport system permease protein
MSNSPEKRVSAIQEAVWAVVLVSGFVSAGWWLLAAVHYNWSWPSVWGYRSLILAGWWTTILICAGALIMSVSMGFILMLGLRSSVVPARMFCRGYVELIRGTPLLVQLLIGYYIVANALRINSPVPVGIILLASFEAAYLAEIFRGALESIGASQLEAARAVGFDRVQIYRHVILPQALRRALPGTAGEMISLIKNSSLLSVIGIEELTQTIKTANAGAYTALEGFIPLALMYLALTLPLSWWARSLEARFRFET